MVDDLIRHYLLLMPNSPIGRSHYGLPWQKPPIIQSLLFNVDRGPMI